MTGRKRDDRKKKENREKEARVNKETRRIAKEALLAKGACTCGERKARSKEMSANNYQDHPSTDLPLSFLSLYLFLPVSLSPS